MTHLLNDPTLLGVMLALCGVAVLACAYAATRALWRFWRRRRGAYQYTIAFYDDDGKPVHRRAKIESDTELRLDKGYDFYMGGGEYIDGDDGTVAWSKPFDSNELPPGFKFTTDGRPFSPTLLQCDLLDKIRAEHVSDTKYTLPHLSESAYMDADSNFARALAPISPHDAVVLESPIKDAPVPYRPQGGPVRGAPVTREEFDAVLSRLAILEGAKQGARDNLRGGWRTMAYRGFPGYGGMHPTMRRILDHPPAGNSILAAFARLEKLESALPPDDEPPTMTRAALMHDSYAGAYAQAQANFDAALDSLRTDADAEPDSEIRVWTDAPLDDGRPLLSLWDGTTMWERMLNVPEDTWDYTDERPDVMTDPDTFRELHGDEKARVIADWRENKA